MTKNIAIMDEVYEQLKSVRLPGESFSHAIRRIIQRPQRVSLRDFAGIIKISDEEAERMRDHIISRRRASTERLRRKLGLR